MKEDNIFNNRIFIICAYLVLTIFLVYDIYCVLKGEKHIGGIVTMSLLLLALTIEVVINKKNA
ncbi:MAG: hypothetical protein J6U04_01055 [Salinivirgaceae bacterium]|nr:hypothetical protein [Salinivirgaceae bacterium]